MIPFQFASSQISLQKISETNMLRSTSSSVKVISLSHGVRNLKKISLEHILNILWLNNNLTLVFDSTGCHSSIKGISSTMQSTKFTILVCSDFPHSPRTKAKWNDSNRNITCFHLIYKLFEYYLLWRYQLSEPVLQGLHSKYTSALQCLSNGLQEQRRSSWERFISFYQPVLLIYHLFQSLLLLCQTSKENQLALKSIHCKIIHIACTVCIHDVLHSGFHLAVDPATGRKKKDW